MEQVYKYLTGIKFRQPVEAVIEKFDDMREDLERERRFMGKQWSKREGQILAAVDSIVGMAGDLQGIAGKAMPEIPGLDMPLLDLNREQGEGCATSSGYGSVCSYQTADAAIRKGERLLKGRATQ